VATIVLTDGPRLFVQENVDGRFVIAQVAATGGETVVIPTPFPNVSLLNISTDKSQLMVGSFTASQDQQPIWSLPALGGAPKAITEIPAADGAWMPSGHILLAQNNQLVELAPDGPRKLSALPDFTYWLRWSPDGKVMRLNVNEATGTNVVWDANGEGTQVHRFLPAWRKVLHGQGNFTPDGRYFVFEVVHGTQTDVWATREKGDVFHRMKRDPIRLTSGPMNFISPQPSLDGRKIFVVGEQPRAELMRHDPKSGQFVPYLGGASIGDVSFSPDGEWAAYVSHPEGTLWRSRKDGNQRLQLTSGPELARLPKWSPDGKQIAFAEGAASAHSHISLVSAAGGQV
jgi:Tol biopolymer transport system component